MVVDPPLECRERNAPLLLLAHSSDWHWGPTRTVVRRSKQSFGAANATMSAKAATMSAKAATMSAKAATMSAKDATKSAKDASMIRVWPPKARP